VTTTTPSDRAPGEVFDGTGPRKPRRGDEFECDVLGLDARGAPRGRVGVHRVEFEGRATGALPGARVRGVVTSRRRAELSARVLEVVTASPHAVPPRCAHVRDCGGCRFQDLAYDVQLEELARNARARLAPLAPFGCEPGPVLGVRDPWRYRNKMDFTFAARRWREQDDDGRHPDFALGLHASGHHEKALDVRACHLQGEVGDRILSLARSLALEHGLRPWDLAHHTGFLRHLVVRRSEASDEWLVYVVTSHEDEPRFETWWRALLAAEPRITTLVHGPTSRVSGVALGDEDRVLFGPGHVREALGSATFRVSARSFFQTNSAQAQRLLDVVRAFALGERAVGGTLLDLYCGAGLFSIALAPAFERVVGVELVEAAVLDARANAEANGVRHAHFEVADAAAWLVQQTQDGAAHAPFDVAIVDPPRAGVHESVVRALALAGPPRLVYVACHLESAARDLAPLLDGSLGVPYRLERSALVDLFPHTPHLEGVFALVRP
jgi:23S rRNA (uracil1939-C5)-methyltransferase